MDLESLQDRAPDRVHLPVREQPFLIGGQPMRLKAGFKTAAYVSTLRYSLHANRGARTNTINVAAFAIGKPSADVLL